VRGVAVFVAGEATCDHATTAPLDGSSAFQSRERQAPSHPEEARERKRLFLVGPRECGTVLLGAARANVNRRQLYRWRSEDENFREAWDAVLEDVADVMEASVYERGLAGDSILSMFWLKSKRPSFRDRLNIDVQAMESEIEERVAALLDHRSPRDLLVEAARKGFDGALVEVVDEEVPPT
jgi:hypothetical protein